MEDPSSLRNLSGWKVSGSGQMEGSWWITYTGMLKFMPRLVCDSFRSLLGVKRTFGNKEAVLLPVFDASPVRSEAWRKQSQGLLDTRLEVRHLLDALLVDLAVTGLHHLVHLLDQLGLHLGVLRQAEGQGGEGAGGCLKASKDEDNCLVQ